MPVYNEKDFIPKQAPGRFPATWEFQTQAPSNIAIIKYWGKKGMQLPMNASLSFLLPQSLTTTKASARLSDKISDKVKFTFLFDGKENASFSKKIAVFFERIVHYVPYVKRYEWTFESENNFPHSAGIASSASGFAALSKILIRLERTLYPEADEILLYHKTSFLARLGSGSASRSVTGTVAVWGTHPGIPGSNDLYAIDYPFEIHREFRRMTDLILLLEKEKKEVSSTTGHGLIDKHPFKHPRIDQARNNLSRLSEALQQGDWDSFGQITENEALTLHAMMMTSNPYFILMQPETLRWISLIWDFRNKTGIPVYFTLDAGANLHLIYPDVYEQKILSGLDELTQAEKIINRIRL